MDSYPAFTSWRVGLSLFLGVLLLYPLCAYLRSWYPFTESLLQYYSTPAPKARDLVGQGADMGRILYESRSLLSFAQATLTTAIAVFIPLLLLAWNQVIDSRADLYGRFLDLKKSLPSAPTANANLVDAELRHIHDDIRELARINKDLRPFFLAIGAAAILVLGASIWKTLDTSTDNSIYLSSPFLMVGSILVFLAFSGLFITFLLAAHPARNYLTRLERLVELCNKQYLDPPDRPVNEA